MSVDVRELQRSLNRFTSKYLRGIKPLAVDDKKGKATNSRIMAVKYYLGYGKRDGSVKSLFVRRMRHPHSARYSTPVMLAVGASRRRRQRKLATRGPLSASDRLWAGSRQFTNRAIRVANRYGVPVTSRKRSGPPIGGNSGSDHNVWNVTADAVDLATFNGAGLAHAIAKDFGISGYRTGNYTGYTVKGRNGSNYRIQILWAVQGHYDHVHVGARRS